MAVEKVSGCATLSVEAGPLRSCGRERPEVAKMTLA